MNEIRRISIGPDYKNAMHYIVGQHVIDGNHIISNIVYHESKGYFIWVKNEFNETVCWKQIGITVPVVLEFNINF